MDGMKKVGYFLIDVPVKKLNGLKPFNLHFVIMPFH